MKKLFLTTGLMFAFVGFAQATTVTPKITKISVTPTSAPAGTMFKFSAELDNPLPTGNKVKIDLGKGFASMTGKNTSYSLSRAIYTTGAQTYKVGIYNAKNVLQGKVSSGSYAVTSITSINHAPTLSLVKAETTATTNIAYIITLNAKDIDANLSSITINWGDNSEPETLTTTDGKDLTFSHIYTSASSFGWNAFASDKGSPVLNSKSISKIVTVSNPEPVEVKGDIETFVSGSKTFSYTKIANDGSELPKTAKLGTGAKDWACTKDNNTGLIWKSQGDFSFSWYEPDYLKNGNDEGYKSTLFGTPHCPVTLQCNTHDYAEAINIKGLCGKNDWRLPNYEELKTLVYCSDGQYNLFNGYGNICTGSPTSPAINTTYFPDSFYDKSYHIVKELRNFGYWSASPDFSDNKYLKRARLISFKYGYSGAGHKGSDYYVRLVRNAK